MRAAPCRSLAVHAFGLLTLVGGLATAAPAGAQVPARTSAGAWNRVAATAAPPSRGLATSVAPKRFAAFDLDARALGAVLVAAPPERSRAARSAPLVVSLPNPEGRFERFEVVDSPVMEPGLAAAHPEIQTFAGRGIDEPTANVRFDLTPLGVHASVRSAERSWFIDPRYTGDDARHVSYYRSDLADPRAGVPYDERELAEDVVERAAADRAAGEVVRLRAYRLALVSDPTYARTSNGTGQTTAAKAVLMNRVNQIYETDLAIRMVLIDATDKLNLDTDALATGSNGPCGAAPCFTAAQLSGCTGTLLARNGVVAGQLAVAREFDIGHIVLGKAGGGVAGLGVVGETNKARGCTGIPRPVGDFFAVDYVAHEMGHQFSGNHPFNGVQANCSLTNRSGLTSTEPGSGSSVMAYAGICDQDDLQNHSDPNFSQRSIDEITSYVRKAPANASSVQRASLTSFDGTDSFRLAYATGTSVPIVRGTNYTAGGIKAAIEGIPGFPSGGTVSVTGFSGSFDDTGFTVTFGGSQANQAVELLRLVEPVGATGYVGETIKGGPGDNGGITVTPTANRAPGVTTARAFAIPVQTPFTLSSAGTDLDGDPLTYLWEQNDEGNPGLGTALVDNNKTNGPLFRVFGTAARYPEEEAYLSPSPGENVATDDPARSFPDVRQVLAGNTNAVSGSCPTVRLATQSPTGETVVPGETVTPDVQDCFSEFLPTPEYTGADGTRTLNFRVTVRDNVAGAGGTSFADTTLTASPTAGPFRVTSQASQTTANAGTRLPVTWDVANTTAPPVGTADVRILLSTDGGTTFDRVLAAATPNDGAEQVALPPGISTTTGRIRVEAVGNVFFDLSRSELRIVDPGSPTGAPGETAPGQTAPEGTTGSTGTTGASGESEVTPPTSTTTSTTTTATPTPTTTPTPSPSPAPATATATTPSGGPAGPAGPVGSTIDIQPDYAAFLVARREARGSFPRPIGTVGSVRLYSVTRSTALGRPTGRARRLIIAVCLARPCRVTSSARIRTTPRRGRAVSRSLRLNGLRLLTASAGTIVLPTTAADRRRIRAARTATATLTIRADGKKRTRTYRFRTG